MRWFVLGPLAIAAGTAFGVTSSSSPPGELPRYLLTAHEAFVLRDAQLVAPPPTAIAEWSSDGMYVLAVRGEKPPPSPIGGSPTGGLGLSVWDRRTGHAPEIWKRPPGLQRVEQLGWLPGTHTALMVVASANPRGRKPESRRTLFWVDTAHRLVRPLRALSAEELQISPRQPLAVLLDGSHERLRVIRADRSIAPPLRLWGEIPGISRWSPDGGAFYWCRFGRRRTPAPAPPVQWLATNLRTGVTTVLSLDPNGVQEPKSYQEKALPVQLRSDVRFVPEAGPAQRISLLWLESAVWSGRPRLLVCADSEGGHLAPDASAVLYLSQGAAWVAPLTRLPRAQMLARAATTQRQLAMFRARQIAHALSLYAQDYDGAYPPMGDTALDAIRPYLGPYEAITPPEADAPEFVYRYTGGPVKSLKSPRITEVGYIPGPGGRAVILADRHVEWRGDQPERSPAGSEPGPGHVEERPAPPRPGFPPRRTLAPPPPAPRPPRYPGPGPGRVRAGAADARARPTHSASASAVIRSLGY
jgi:hypothetical protein